MKSKFRAGIVLFSVVLPFLGLGILAAVLLSQKSQLEAKYQAKKEQSLKNKQAEMTLKGIQSRLTRYEGKKEIWSELIAQSDVTNLNKALKEIAASFDDPRTFNQTEFKFDNNGRGIGAVSQQPSFSFDLTLNGTFRSIQTGLLSLESQMPNLSLNSMTLSPRPNDQLLQAQLSYSAWSQ